MLSYGSGHILQFQQEAVTGCIPMPSMCTQLGGLHNISTTMSGISLLHSDPNLKVCLLVHIYTSMSEMLKYTSVKTYEIYMLKDMQATPWLVICMHA